MASPPPVESDEDFTRRLGAVETARPRLCAIACIVGGLAGLAIATHWPWLTT